MEASQPGIICIVESWLCKDIEDKEIDIPGYIVHRLDRNRHGGGIVMYTGNHLDVKTIPDLPSNLEFFVVSIRFFNHIICLCHPPSSHSSLLDIFSQSLETLDISQSSNFVCVGDFNIDYNDSAHHLYPKLSSISQLLAFGLSQAVTGYTHVSPSGHTSLTDLVLVSSPHHISDCFVIPPLANSDHLGLHIKLDFKPLAQPKSSRSYARAIWRYSHADFPLAQQRIIGTNWDELFTDDIDSSWLSWQSKFLEIMEECIPWRVLPPRRRNSPG